MVAGAETQTKLRLLPIINTREGSKWGLLAGRIERYAQGKRAAVKKHPTSTERADGTIPVPADETVDELAKFWVL